MYYLILFSFVLLYAYECFAYMYIYVPSVCLELSEPRIVSYPLAIK